MKRVLSPDEAWALRYSLGYLIACERGGQSMFPSAAMREGAVLLTDWLDAVQEGQQMLLTLEVEAVVEVES